jgi:hypothetical protein
MSTVNLGKIFQGDTLQLDFVCQDQDGDPQDLTDCSIKWGLAPSSDMASPIITKTVGSGVTITGAVTGRCQVLIGQGEINVAGVFFHELEITLPSGSSYTFAQGMVIVMPTVYPST